jgi:hypothetical protein
MRGIKQFTKEKNKNNNNVIKLNIGGEVKHYPILSWTYYVDYILETLNYFYNSNNNLIITTNASNLIFLLSDLSYKPKFDIYINNRDFLGCFVKSYSVNEENITTFEISVDYLRIN